jgi:hypothetical protein
MAKVGTGIPGFMAAEANTGSGGFAPWKGKFLCEIVEVTAKDVENGCNVKIETTVLDGDAQGDDVAVEGKKKFWFINVSYEPERDFTKGYLKALFVAAGVKVTSDEPPYGKLAGKRVAVEAWSRNDNKGEARQSQKFVAVRDSKWKDADD